jgi:putative DNA primase/helicase
MSNILKVINGDINLETGEFTSKYNHNCPIQTEYKGIYYDTMMIDKYMEELMDHNQINSFQKALGAHLVKNQSMIDIYGNGSNGKSTFVNLLHKLLGSNISWEPSSLITTDFCEWSVSAINSVIITMDELDSSDDIKWDRVKTLVGNNPIKARLPFGELQEGTCGNLLTVSTDKLSPEDYGMKKRLRSFHFNNNFLSNPNKYAELEKNLDQLLVWLVKGSIKNHMFGNDTN